jgi:shikimate kinase
MSIADLITAEGEAAFRALEAEVLADALAKCPSVIATGGGTPVQTGAMDKLKAAGLVVYLPVLQEVAVARISADKEERLHLAGDTAAKWAALLEKREAIYQQAHVVCQDTAKLLAFVQAHAPTRAETAPTFRG